MTPNKNYLSDFEELTEPKIIILGDGKNTRAIGTGELEFVCGSYGGELREVLLV